MINYEEKHKTADVSGDKYVTYETAGINEDLQSVLYEKQRLLNASIADLAEGRECKYCAYIDKCSMRQVERNLAFKSCSRWQWRGAKAADKTAEMSSIKQ